MSKSLGNPLKWTVSVPGDLDVALRVHLAARGAKKGDLSRFVAEAVRQRLYALNLKAAQAHNLGLSGEVLDAEIEQALAQVRAERFAKPL
jgi:hypothetical protein